MTPGNSSPFGWISRLIRALYREGVRFVYLSPGSRSTPMALAVAVHPGFKKQVVLDERSAAFQALGSAKITGKPSLLICTSGTAAANYLPALVEARHTSTPVIVLTADRPPYLRNSGSSQTIDQIKLFGDYTVMYHEIGEPVDDERDLNRLDLLAKQAVLTSVGTGGGVHLNAAFRKPLEPAAHDVDRMRALCLGDMENMPDTGKPASTGIHVRITLSDTLNSLINQSVRPLIIAGTDNPGRAPVETFRKIAAVTAAPVINEPGSNLPVSASTLHGFELLFQKKKMFSELKPDLIIRFGASPSSGTINRLLEANRDVPSIQFLTTQSWQDEYASVDHRIILAADSLDTTGLKKKSAGWYRKIAGLETPLKSDRKKLLEDERKLTDGHIVDFIIRELPPHWDVMLSNSFIIRDFSLFSSGRVPEQDTVRHGVAPLPPETTSGRVPEQDTVGQGVNKTERKGFQHNRIITNRGAAGIDGILSTAAGAARASENPLVCITGDLAFLHDINALLSLKKMHRPFLIVVINNGGGTIFRMLPISQMQTYYREYFETAQEMDIQHLAKAYNLNYKLISSRKQIGLIEFQETPDDSATVIECRTDADASMIMRRSLWDGNKHSAR